MEQPSSLMFSSPGKLKLYNHYHHFETIFFSNISSVCSKLTGASMNPVRSIGPAVAVRSFRKLWIYIVAPFIGTVGAALLYNLLRSPVGLRKNQLKNITGKIKSTLNPAYDSGILLLAYFLSHSRVFAYVLRSLNHLFSVFFVRERNGASIYLIMFLQRLRLMRLPTLNHFLPFVVKIPKC